MCQISDAPNVTVIYNYGVAKKIYVLVKGEKDPREFVGESVHEIGTQVEGFVVIKDEEMNDVGRIQRSGITGWWTEDALPKQGG